MKMLFFGVRRRVVVYSCTILGAWPLHSALMAAIEARTIPYYSPTWIGAIAGGLAGTVILAPDFFIVGFIGIIVAVLVFTNLGPKESLISKTRLTAEPLLLFLSILFGTSLNYPAILTHPGLLVFRSLPVWVVTVLLAIAVLCMSLFLGSPKRRFKLFIVVMIIGLGSSLPVSRRASWSAPSLGHAPLVLLGLDSLSHHDDLESLKSWFDGKKGIWYLRAVPPGLLTNSVWASLLTMRPVREHGIFHTFQSFQKTGEEETLVEKARAAGYHTVSVFPDQLTCWIGTEGGFDEDRSGPIGWRQLAVSYVENASVLLPLFRPVLPKLPFSTVSLNHAGTFTYDLDRELDEIFSMRSLDSPVFVAAHLTFLHLPRYPRYFELSWEELLEVLSAKVRLVRDRSFDWQDVDLPSDPIPLGRWKTRRLLAAVTGSIENTGFLKRGGRLVLFSDHGNRSAITVDNFWEERYHHVPLVTLGLPSRNPETPLSLIDVGSLLGIIPSMSAFDPVVEFTLAPSSEWSNLVRTARLRLDGSVELDKQQLGVIFRNLRSYRPWPRPILPKVYPVFDGR